MSEKLSGARKAAILLLSLGEEAASEVLKNLTEVEIREVTRQMRTFEDISQAQVQRVANEYYMLAERGRFLPGSPETKTAFLRRILGRAMGEEEAERIIEGVLENKNVGELERLQWHDPATIAEFVSGEHPQVMAVILANLGDPDLTRMVLEALPDHLRPEVLARLLRIREVSEEWIEEIESSLEEEINQTEKAHGENEDSGSSAGASDRVAGVLNATSSGMQQTILDHIEKQDPALAAKIRNQMFPFEEFIKVDHFSIQKVLERCTNQDLVYALRTADDGLRRHFFRNLSPENAKSLAEAIEGFGPIRISEIEAAQNRLSNIARELAVQGELHLLQRRK